MLRSLPIPDLLVDEEFNTNMFFCENCCSGVCIAEPTGFLAFDTYIWPVLLDSVLCVLPLFWLGDLDGCLKGALCLAYESISDCFDLLCALFCRSLK